MSNYKVGDKFKVVRITGVNLEGRRPFIGKTFTVESVNPNGSGLNEHYGVEGKCPYIFFVDEVEPVEEKKMFTKSDLKTGMFGVMDNGFKFVVVNDCFIYSNGEWDKVSNFKDDLTATWKKVMKVFDRVKSFSHLDYALDNDDPYVKLVYDRERDTKKLYNGKVVCIDLDGCNHSIYTVGKIYQFKDGILCGDNGFNYPCEPYDKDSMKIHSFEEWADWTGSKFIEVVE